MHIANGQIQIGIEPISIISLTDGEKIKVNQIELSYMFNNNDEKIEFDNLKRKAVTTMLAVNGEEFNKLFKKYQIHLKLVGEGEFNDDAFLRPSVVLSKYRPILPAEGLILENNTLVITSDEDVNINVNINYTELKL